MHNAVSHNDPCASSEAIQFHYDVGNDFYQLWLDPTMTYSCAFWQGDENLETAQRNKIDWHLQHSGIQPGERLLEIGGGWGGLLDRAINHIGVKHATSLTLSQAQAEWIRNRQLPNVDVRLESWFAHTPDTLYDGIVSVEAFEAFARPDQTDEEKLEGYKTFFQSCHRWLRPGGRLSLQTITYEKLGRDWNHHISEKVFPDEDLPHLEEIVTAARGFFEIELLRNDRAHYVRTLRCWLSNLRAKKSEAIEMVGAEKVAIYEKYLGLVLVGFYTGTMNLARISLRRIDSRGGWS
ncbi:MAG: cyclopropane-fatty-acyl-phospholipid synthase family protein [Pseudomonadota bacterium]